MSRCIGCGVDGLGDVTHVCPPPSVMQPVFPTPKRPHRCPICEGRGTVPPDFYNQFGVSTNTARLTCRACGGNGIVIA